MKICTKCNCYNKDTSRVCTNCGATLKDCPKVNEDEFSNLLHELNEKMDHMNLTKTDRVFQILFLLGLSFSILLIIFLGEESAVVSVVALVFFAIGYFTCAFPKALWSINKALLSITTDSNDITPNDMWFFNRKVGYIICCVAGSALNFLAMGLIAL